MAKTIKQLEPPDSHHARAALGWLELGDHLEANGELERIAPELRGHPAVLEIRWQIYAKALQWDACADIARTLAEMQPHEPSGWIQLAYATRRATPEGIKAARDILLSVVGKFPDTFILPYNLACYAAQLNELTAARDWLEKALAIGKRTNCHDQVRLMALEDPDLELFWQEIGSLPTA